MKYIVFLGDGMADLPLPQYDNKTPLMIAAKPGMDAIASQGLAGMVKTVPDTLAPGSDTAI
jgi:2,3-bisphosphoglycerate-independent phosphoglycerate mutase